jgi:hypothetical protein
MKNRIGIHTGLKGMYKIEAVAPDGTKRLLADWFPNLITDNGLEIIGTTGAFFSYCCVGSGNNAPANSDTTLQTYVANSSAQTVFTRAAASTAPYFGSSTVTYRFAAGVATGNLAEVGIGPTGGGVNLFSRALILDGGGSPTTITVLSSEALDVTYQLQLYSPTTDVTGTVVIAGVSYNYTIRAANANTTSWSPFTYGGFGGIASLQVGQGTINGVTGLPTYTANGGGADSSTRQTYGAGNHYVDTVFGFSLNFGNAAGGINCMNFYAGASYNDLGAFQLQLDASIPKDNSHVLSLTLRHTWGRYP